MIERDSDITYSYITDSLGSERKLPCSERKTRIRKEEGYGIELGTLHTKEHIIYSRKIKKLRIIVIFVLKNIQEHLTRKQKNNYSNGFHPSKIQETNGCDAIIKKLKKSLLNI